MSLEAISEAPKDKRVEGKEQRRSRRYLCEGFAEVYANDTGNLFRGEIQDISQTGCYIKTNVRLKLPRLSEVDLVFTVNKRSYRFLARVMDVRPGKGVGLEFVLYEPGDTESIRKLLQMLANEESQRQELSENAEANS